MNDTNKMIKMIGLAAAFMFVLVLGMYTMGGGDKVGLQIVDQNMMISKNNAQMNANAFKRTVYPDAIRVLMGSDSTIGADCRNGDGWSSGKITLKDNTDIDIKCQTYGNAKGIEGCLTKQEFNNKAVYAAEDGVCNEGITELPKMK